MGGLYIVGHQETADAAWDLYRALRDGLDRHVYVAERDRAGDEVRPRSKEEYLALNDADLAHQARKTQFLNRVRVELGLPELAPNAPVFPDEEPAPPETAVSASIAIEGSAFTQPPRG